MREHGGKSLLHHAPQGIVIILPQTIAAQPQHARVRQRGDHDGRVLLQIAQRFAKGLPRAHLREQHFPSVDIGHRHRDLPRQHQAEGGHPFDRLFQEFAPGIGFFLRVKEAQGLPALVGGEVGEQGAARGHRITSFV